MSPTFARAVLLVLVVTFPLAAEDKPPALQRTGEAVSATPQTLAERAKTMRVNRAVFDDFRPPQVIFDPGSTSKSAPPPATSSGNLPGASSGPPQSQPRRINPLGEYFNAKANAEATQRCPKATTEQKQAADERLARATQNYERGKAQTQQRQRQP